MGRLGLIVTAALIMCAPAWLFADSLNYYQVQGDDFAYIGASRTLHRAMENLFVPHNAHIVPTWRMLTWGLVAWAGKLSNLATVLGWATFAIIPAVMLAVGVLVGRETGRTSSGLVAMAFAGTTSVLKSSATWYSAGQTLWAGWGVLLTLLALQGWRRNGGFWRLVLAALAAVFAGGFWTIGHVAGPAGSAYLWADGRSSSRKAAIVPLLASILAIAVSFSLGAKKIEVEVRFEGKDQDKAINFSRGASHTIQSISETLVLGNLGVAAETTPTQAAVLTFALLGFWAWSFRNGGQPTPLEASGAVIVLAGYLVSWSFRGYYLFTSLRGVVPWYDTIPHLGAILFAAGWWSRSAGTNGKQISLTRGGAIGVIVLTLGLIVIHQPRVDTLFLKELPPLTADEEQAFPILELQRLRSATYSKILFDWRREHWYRLDLAEARGKQLGIGRDAIRSAFGRVDTPGLPAPYDAADMLDFPRTGKPIDPEVVKAEFGPLFLIKPRPEFPLADVLRLPR